VASVFSLAKYPRGEGQGKKGPEMADRFLFALRPRCVEPYLRGILRALAKLALTATVSPTPPQKRVTVTG